MKEIIENEKDGIFKQNEHFLELSWIKNEIKISLFVNSKAERNFFFCNKIYSYFWHLHNYVPKTQNFETTVGMSNNEINRIVSK